MSCTRNLQQIYCKSLQLLPPRLSAQAAGVLFRSSNRLRSHPLFGQQTDRRIQARLSFRTLQEQSFQHAVRSGNM